MTPDRRVLESGDGWTIYRERLEITGKWSRLIFFDIDGKLRGSARDVRGAEQMIRAIIS